MAELLAAGTALGVASSIITFCDVGWRLLKRIREYNDKRKNVPEILRHIEAQLPALIEKVEELKGDGQTIGSQTALGKAVISCENQITILEEIIIRLIPSSTDSRTARTRKAISSMWREDELAKAVVGDGTVQIYIHLCLHRCAQARRLVEPTN
jgi:hypothetical protein